jgi:MoaA/NifB/PqqE/SkfB family radical SAM enzyme
MVPWHIIKTKLSWETRKLLAEAEFRIRRPHILRVLESSISHLSIETTNICNANCIFCAYQYQSRPTGIMSEELFCRLIDEFAELGGGELGLTPTVGDPLIDPRLVERIRYARSKQCITRIGMYTNMISLDRQGLTNLLHSGVDTIIVSTSGFDEAMYRRVYRSQMYKQMLDNVKRFAAANNDAGRPVDFQIDMRADRPAGEIYNFSDYQDVARLVGAEKIGVKFRYDNWAGFITPSQLSGNMLLRDQSKSKGSPCSELYGGPIVFWDGRVGACGCRDVNASELVIGDAMKSHLGEIWFGNAIRQLREEFVTDKIRPICQSCTHYNSVGVVLMRRERYTHLNTRSSLPLGLRSGN